MSLQVWETKRPKRPLVQEWVVTLAVFKTPWWHYTKVFQPRSGISDLHLHMGFFPWKGRRNLEKVNKQLIQTKMYTKLTLTTLRRRPRRLKHRYLCWDFENSLVLIGSQGPELGLLHDSRENSTTKKEEKIWELFVKIYSNNIWKKKSWLRLVVVSHVHMMIMEENEMGSQKKKRKKKISGRLPLLVTDRLLPGKVAKSVIKNIV